MLWEKDDLWQHHMGFQQIGNGLIPENQLFIDCMQAGENLELYLINLLKTNFLIFDVIFYYLTKLFIYGIDIDISVH